MSYKGNVDDNVLVEKHSWGGMRDLVFLVKLAGGMGYFMAWLPWYFVTLRPRYKCSVAIAEALVRLLEWLGPVYLKLGQIASTRYSELPLPFIRQMSRLQDKVRAVPESVMIRHVERSLGKPICEVFKDFSISPIAAGSVAQVHKAVLHDGTEVAVKLLRPGARVKAVSALSLFHRIARMLSNLPWFKRMPLLEAYDDLARAILRQFDFRREARMAQRLSDVFAQDAKVHVPRIITNLSNESLIVMEFVRGLVKVEELGNPPWLEESMKTGFRALFKMILDAGVIHCDFHAGNVFFRPNGHVVILDCGFMEELSVREAYQFREFFLGILRRDGAMCARILLETAHYVSQECDRDKFTRDISLLVRAHSRIRAADFHVRHFAFALFAIQQMAGIRGSHRFTLTILALLVYEGIATAFVPDMDFQHESLSVLGPYLMWRSF